jgi:ribosomal protein S27E
MSLDSDSVVGSDSCLDFKYERHRPEETLLYQIVDKHYPDFQALMAAQGSPLPGYFQTEFEEYLKCGLLKHGFLRVRCEGCHHERLVAFSCKRRGFCPSCGARRMVDSALPDPLIALICVNLH